MCQPAKILNDRPTSRRDATVVGLWVFIHSRGAWVFMLWVHRCPLHLISRVICLHMCTCTCIRVG